MANDTGLLILRVVVGLLLAGHGAQKLWGWFGGDGFTGTAGWLGSLGLRPSGLWALLAGLSELVGGVLVATGLGGPLGPLAMMAPMLVAMLKVHLANGVWNEQGGVELPLTNFAAALAFALIGPGRYSLDALFGIALPMPATLIGGLVLVLLGVSATMLGTAPQTKAEHA